MTKKLKQIISESLLIENKDVSKRDIMYLLKETFSIQEVDLIVGIDKEYDDSLLQTHLERLKQGEPVEYILGYASFCGLKYEVNNNTLIPRNETEELVYHINDYIKNYCFDSLDILDIGSGTGCIAISLSKLNKNAVVESVDISSEALEVAKRNNKLNGTNVNFYLSDCFDNVSDKKYDIIVSNPPYIDPDSYVQESVLKYEPHTALFADNHGLAIYEKILKSASRYLKDKFIIAFEISPEQENALNDIASVCFPNSHIDFKKDMNSNTRFMFIFE